MAAVDDLPRADPLPLVVAFLAGHPKVTAALGGPGRVGLYNQAPYPCLTVTDTVGGGDRDLRWLLAPELEFAAFGDLDGAPGKATLRRILYVALGAVTELPELEPAPGDPVITDVRSTRGGGYIPEPTGQPRYVAAVRVWTHPGLP